MEQRKGKESVGQRLRARCGFNSAAWKASSLKCVCVCLCVVRVVVRVFGDGQAPRFGSEDWGICMD